MSAVMHADVAAEGAIKELFETALMESGRTRGAEGEVIPKATESDRLRSGDYALITAMSGLAL